MIPCRCASIPRSLPTIGKLPVVNFAAGGVATPADAALCMQLGVDGVFVGSGIFKSQDPAKRARAIVKAVPRWRLRGGNLGVGFGQGKLLAYSQKE